MNLGLNAGLDAVLYKPLGIGGIPLSTAIVSLLTTVALAVVLRPRLGGLDGGRTLDAGIRIMVAARALAGGRAGAPRGASGAPGRRLRWPAAGRVVAGGAGMLVYWSLLAS